jgi:hypothetical protein
MYGRDATGTPASDSASGRFGVTTRASGRTSVMKASGWGEVFMVTER